MTKPKGKGPFGLAINALADFRVGLTDDGPQKGWLKQINRAIAVLTAAGEVKVIKINTVPAPLYTFPGIIQSDDPHQALLKAIDEAEK